MKQKAYRILIGCWKNNGIRKSTKKSKENSWNRWSSYGRKGFDMELSEEYFEYDKYNFFEAAKSIGIHLTEEGGKESNFALA